MRTLAAAPQDLLDRSTGKPAFGSYAGPLPTVTLGSGLLDRALRRKRWVYVALATDTLWISLAAVRMGYATSAFAFVHELGSGRMLYDKAVVGPPRAAVVADDVHASGVVASFDFARTHVTLERSGASLELRARFGGLAIDAVLDESNAPPSVSAIAQPGPNLVSVTEKRALLGVRGTVVAAGRTIVLDGGMAGWDYSHGLMPRRTRWHWAFGLGRDRGGEPIGFNVVEGFVGEAECAAFYRGEVHPIHEPRFGFDPERLAEPWTLKADGIDLRFEVGAVHAQRTNLGIVRSRFVQPVGAFHGALRIGGHDVELAGVPGVVEDQDVVW